MNRASAGGLEEVAWEYLAKGARIAAIRAMREGARISLGRGRSNRMKDYADAIEATQLVSRADIEKYLENEIMPEGMGGDM